MNKKFKISYFFYTLVLAVIIFLLYIGILVYVFQKNNSLTQKVLGVVPFPAVVLNYTNFITLHDVSADLASVERFYENQDFSSLGFRIDFKTADGQKRLKIKEKGVLNKQIENFVIQNVAQKNGITISDEQVSQEVERKLQELGNRREIEASLEKLYGWDIEKFKEKIVKPEIYKEKMVESFLLEGNKLEKAQGKINLALEELTKNGKFEAVVSQYSEGESAKNGGELGWFGADQMLPEISSVAFQLKKNQTSEIVQSSLGFHILQVTDTKIENEIPLVKIRQIFVRIPSFADWLMEQEKNFKIKILMPEYIWSEENQQVEFIDPEMKKFEENVIENSPGDISVIF